MDQTLILSRNITKSFTYNGYPVTVECERGHCADEADPTTLTCLQCGLPYVIAQAILVMANFNIRSMTVDGAELRRVA